MTDSHILTSGLKRRLLSGSSTAAIVLAAMVAITNSAHAQQTELAGDQSYDANTDGAILNNGFFHDGTATTHTVTINLNTTVTEQLGAITNANTNANGLVFNIIDSTGIADTLTFGGDVAASNDGFITFNVGEGTTLGVTATVENNVTEAGSGVTSFVLGNSGADGQAINLNFASATATQTIDAAISVVDDGDNITLRVGNSAVSSTTTFNDTITLRGSDTLAVGSTGGTSTTSAAFMADVAAPGSITIGGTTVTDATFSGSATSAGGITLNGNATTTATFAGDVAANITLNATGAAQTLILGSTGQTTTATGSLDVSNTTNTATLTIADGANVTLAGDINSAAAWDAINVGGGTTATTFTVQGHIADESAITLNNLGTLVIDSTAATRNLASAIDADAGGSSVTFQITGDSGDANVVNVNGAIGGFQAIDTLTLGDDVTFSQAVNGGTLTAATGVDATLQANSAITGDITGAGNLIVGNAATDVLTLGGGTGTTSTISITGFDGPGDVAIASGSSVTFNSTIGGTTPLSDFTMNTANTTVTVNSTATTAATIGGVLTLDDGTIVLGSNIGAGDTAFSVASLDHTGGATTEIQLSVGFTTGIITFVDSGLNEGDELAGFTVTDNALATYDLRAEAGAMATDHLVIEATARTADATATQLGVSAEVADTVLQAVTSATTAGDTTGLNALSAELNAGGARATQAANQIGVQADAVGAASGVAFEVSGQQQSLASNRLSGLRGSYSQYASAYADSGFSAGDRDGFYAYPPETRGSIWFEGFGGYAHADGDTSAAGYHAGFGGATAGIDGTISDQVTVGVMGSYTYSTVDGEGAGDAQMDTNTYQIALYGSYTTDRFYVDGFASYAYAETEASRTAVGETITGDYGSSQFALGIAAGAPLDVGSNVYVTPNASLTWNHYAADDYTETGSLGFSARVTPDAVSQLTGTIGARIHAVHENFTPGGASLVPELRIGLGYDIVDDDAVSTATFTGGGTSYTVTGTDTDNIAALLGLGVSLDHADWEAGLTYDADIRSDFMSHTARAEYRYRF